MLVSAQRLRSLEEQQAARRQLNRTMVQEAQGAVCHARGAYRNAHQTVRSWLMLDPSWDDQLALPDPLGGESIPLATPGRPRREPPLGATTQRCLDLLVQGARPRAVQQIVGLSRNRFDGLLRESLGALGARDRRGAVQAWRARAQALGHHPSAQDQAALARLR